MIVLQKDKTNPVLIFRIAILFYFSRSILLFPGIGILIPRSALLFSRSALLFPKMTYYFQNSGLVFHRYLLFIYCVHLFPRVLFFPAGCTLSLFCSGLLRAGFSVMGGIRASQKCAHSAPIWKHPPLINNFHGITQ